LSHLKEADSYEGEDKMREFTVKIKALTPIWTGDAERKCSVLRETGVIGSLRWWYEVLIRGLGGYACDPTNESKKCNLEQNKFNKAISSGKSIQEALDEQICPSCQLFGCTGWGRKFRLEVEFNTTIPEAWIGTREKQNNKYLKRNVSGLMADGTIVLKFTPLKEITSNEWISLNKTLEIIENCGALGAKISQGNGVIEIVENNLPHKDEKIKEFGNSNDNKLPNLKKFFFCKFHVEFKEDISDLIKKKVFWTHSLDHTDFQDNWENWKKFWNDYHFLPIAFHIRDIIRPLENNRDKRHEIFGKLGSGSKVFVSHGYKMNEKAIEFRIFGYDVDIIKSKIKENLNRNLKDKLFSTSNDYFADCKITEEKTGEKILEEVR